MPVTLQPISRRSFVTGVVAGGLAVLTRNRHSFGQATATNTDRFAILSDTHIDADIARVQAGVNMADHLREAIRQVLSPATGNLPGNIIINGDCARGTGESADYAALLPLLQPAIDARLPIHMSLGNHDHRERFIEAMSAPALSAGVVRPAVESRHVSFISTPKLDVILLDTLLKTDLVTGEIGQPQMNWLKAKLDAIGDKPVIVFTHHHPEPMGVPLLPPSTQPATRPFHIIGAKDGPALLDVLTSKRNVKALFWGHRHAWTQTTLDGLHLIGLPAVAYVFDAKQPNGWVDCLADDGGAKLSLRCVKPGDDREGQTIDLRWRT